MGSSPFALSGYACTWSYLYQTMFAGISVYLGKDAGIFVVFSSDFAA